MEEATIEVDNNNKQRDNKSNIQSQPRIGPQYQADIESSISEEFDTNYYLQNPQDTTETKTNSSNDIWTKIEQDSLMIGLYIFGKKFAQLKNFVGSKTIGDIQTFYYTKFYNSEVHKKWVAYKKAIKGKKEVYKQRLFTGLTHHQLLSRMLHNESVENCGNKLLEVSKKFREQKLTLEDYVAALKDLVGLEALIDAVAVGKDNDLTNLTANSMKSVNSILAGEDFSKLTYFEIIHILTSGFQMRKSQSSNLFWKAVWPRLIDNGWHKEKYGSYNKNLTSYIVPGAEEFSRKLLVKGIHYFDSISDVLDKVTSNPELIQHSSNEKKSTSVVSSNMKKNPLKEVSPKGSNIGINLPNSLIEAEVDQSAGKEVDATKFDELDHVVTISTSENPLRNQLVETLRKSSRSSKLSKKAWEYFTNQFEEESQEETSNKRRRR